MPNSVPPYKDHLFRCEIFSDNYPPCLYAKNTTHKNSVSILHTARNKLTPRSSFWYCGILLMCLARSLMDTCVQVKVHMFTVLYMAPLHQDLQHASISSFGRNLEISGTQLYMKFEFKSEALNNTIVNLL